MFSLHKYVNNVMHSSFFVANISISVTHKYLGPAVCNYTKQFFLYVGSKDKKHGTISSQILSFFPVLSQKLYKSLAKRHKVTVGITCACTHTHTLERQLQWDDGISLLLLSRWKSVNRLSDSRDSGSSRHTTFKHHRLTYWEVWNTK